MGDIQQGPKFAAGARRMRVWKVLGLSVAAFGLAAIVGPRLVNLHQNLALIGGVGCYLLAIFAAGAAINLCLRRS